MLYCFCIVRGDDMDYNKDENPFDQEPKSNISNYILDDTYDEEVINDLPFNTKDNDVISKEDIKICTDSTGALYSELDNCQSDLLDDMPFNTIDGQEIDRKDVAICDDLAGIFFMKPDGDEVFSRGNIPSGINDLNDARSKIGNGDVLSRSRNISGTSSRFSRINDGASKISDISNLSGVGSRASHSVTDFSHKVGNPSDIPFGVRSTLPKEEVEILSLFDEQDKEKLKKRDFSDSDRHVKNSKNTNNKYVILLVSLGALLMMWYTTFAQPLGFNNAQKQVSESPYVSWDIKFTDMYQKRKVGSAKEISSPSYSSTKANFHVSLSNPGDEITYNLTIKNAGTLNAKISSIYVLPENSPEDAILYHVDGIKVGDYLDAGQSTNMTVTAKFNENSTVGNKNIKSVSVIINYVQR